MLQDIWVQGEVSNFSRPKSGHLYFTLKDSHSSLRCVMWRNIAQRQRFIPSDGQLIEVHGSLNIYEVQGQYQLYGDSIRLLGEGALFQEFLRIKSLLESEGLFDQDLKQPIPQTPQCIGIVTSATGAAVQDIIHTIRRRYPIVRIVISPSSVQGKDAPMELISAIDRLNKYVQPDIIILARGGGSLEDLWAFNDEILARAIVSSKAPVITGIGHETDFTIADFASDLRGPTPTAAAELATPDKRELKLSLLDNSQRLERLMNNRLENSKWALERISSRLELHSPQSNIRNDRQRMDEFANRMARTMEQQLIVHHTILNGIEKSLLALNPQAILERGFAAISDQAQRPISRAMQVNNGDHINIQFADGKVSATVNDT